MTSFIKQHLKRNDMKHREKAVELVEKHFKIISGFEMNELAIPKEYLRKLLTNKGE